MYTMSSDTKAVVLLCCHFAKRTTIAPLTPSEYRKVALCLWKEKKRPADLITDSNLLEIVSKETSLDLIRLRNLISRGVEMGIALEEWDRHGIWIVSKADLNYPDNFRVHLKHSNPPLLFGIGNPRLLSRGGLAVVGSRNVDEAGLAFTQNIAQLTAENSKTLISGGARGVDTVAMETVLKLNGSAVGILSDNLLKTSLVPLYRKAISQDRLALISPYYPTAPFSVGNAMGRNKLIYSLADYTVVVSSDYNKGGTWNGAKEELRRDNHKKVFVRIEPNCPEGNKRLLELGAIRWPSLNQGEPLWDVLNRQEAQLDSSLDLFADCNYCNDSIDSLNAKPDEKKGEKSNSLILKSEQTEPEDEIFQAILPILIKHLVLPMSLEELSSNLFVSQAQLRTWINKAISIKRVIKHTKPVKYQAIDNLEQSA